MKYIYYLYVGFVTNVVVGTFDKPLFTHHLFYSLVPSFRVIYEIAYFFSTDHKKRRL